MTMHERWAKEVCYSADVAVAGNVLEACRHQRRVNSAASVSEKSFHQLQVATHCSQAVSLVHRDKHLSTVTILKVAAELAHRIAQGVEA